MTTLQQSIDPHIAIPEDNMEISSEFGHIDGDIEIDFDGTNYQFDQPARDNDYMLEDFQSETLDEGENPNNDDIMFDEDGLGRVNEHDQMMQDDFTTYDEEFQDASEIEQQHADLGVEANESTFLQSGDDGLYDEEPLDVDITNARVYGDQMQSYTEYGEPLQRSEAATPAAASCETHGPDGTATQEGFAPSISHNGNQEQLRQPTPTEHTGLAGFAQEEGYPDTQPTVYDQTDEHHAFYPNLTDDTAVASELPLLGLHADASSHESNLTSGAQLDASNQAQASGRTPDPEYAVGSEGSQNQQDSGVLTLTSDNRIILVYKDHAYPMFPTGDNVPDEIYFLNDKNFASRSLGDLFQECRNLLASHATEEDELKLTFHNLGLCISEDCTSAFTASISEISEVYAQLQEQDGVEDIAPLYVTLSKRVNFSSRLSSLKQAAAEGKGISQLQYLQSTDGSDNTFRYDPGERISAEDAEACTQSEGGDTNEPDHMRHSVGSEQSYGEGPPEQPMLNTTDESQGGVRASPVTGAKQADTAEAPHDFLHTSANIEAAPNDGEEPHDAASSEESRAVDPKTGEAYELTEEFLFDDDEAAENQIATSLSGSPTAHDGESTDYETVDPAYESSRGVPSRLHDAGQVQGDVLVNETLEADQSGTQHVTLSTTTDISLGIGIFDEDEEGFEVFNDAPIGPNDSNDHARSPHTQHANEATVPSTLDNHGELDYEDDGQFDDHEDGTNDGHLAAATTHPLDHPHDTTAVEADQDWADGLIEGESPSVNHGEVSLDDQTSAGLHQALEDVTTLQNNNDTHRTTHPPQAEADVIDFSDDDFDPPADDPTHDKLSPSSKRTWDEHADDIELYDDQAQLKKLRSS
ncbi:hypothetical protein LTR50_007328 [Elasticomyces elasticus]|nr:hypothetical protein LTR50_007328 [Elasticomyces elasticus]